MRDPAEETPAERQRRIRRRLHWRGRLAELTDSLELRAGAARAEIRAAEIALDTRFPADYVELMAGTDGASGRVVERRVELWRVTSLRRENAERHSPAGLVIFGSAEPGALLAFQDGQYLILPPGAGLSGAEAAGATALELLEALAQ